MKPIMFVLSVCVVLLAACAPVSPDTPVPDAQTNLPPVTDSSQPVSVKPGETFTIILDSNPSTGYHWDIVGEVDANIVEFVSQDYKGSEPVMPGSGGVERWVFKAVSAGDTQITLGYYPPSNTPVEPEQTTKFNVIVK
jgi:predicted secreted protein